MRDTAHLVPPRATGFRALKVYEKHTPATAIDFVVYVIAKFKFRIHEIRTENSHEFPAKLHWHVEDKGILHAHIESGAPQLNGRENFT